MTGVQTCALPIYDPRVIRIAAVFAIVLSFIPKFSAVICTMPSAIIGGVSFMLYGMISAIGVIKGIAFIKENYDVEHTLDFETILEDLEILCKKNGGTL